MLEKLLIMAIFFVVTLGIGLYCRRHAQNVGDFVLGGRSVGPWVTAFAYGTSYFSSVVFIGYSGQFGWNFGIAATWIGIGNAFIGSLMAWLVLGRRTRVMTKYFESATMPDFFAKRFCCEQLRGAAAMIIFLFLVPYSASVYKGLSGLFSMAFGLPFHWCVIGIAVLTGLYVILGGYMAAAINDLVQGIIMLGGIAMVVWKILSGQGGFFAAIEKLSMIESEIAPAVNGALVSFFGPDPMGLLGVVLLTSLGTWGLPQMIHKFYTIRDERSIHTGTIISTVFALIIAGGSYFMGAFGRLYYTPANGKRVFDEVVPAMLASSLPDFLIGIVLILVLSASMSTLSSLVITSSSTVTLDVLRLLFPKQLQNGKQVLVIKLLCAVFVALSVVIALSPNSLITTLMSLSWGALAGSFLGPFVFGLYWKRTSKASVWASFAWGIGVTCLNFFFPFTVPTTAGALAIVGSLFVVPLVSVLTPALPHERIEDAFACYDRKVTTRSRFVLAEEEM